jgi:UDPglucose--hexose-1-phosphate uridylyltransferase
MSERRWNPQLREWVITATHRQDRTFLPPADACPLDVARPGQPPTEIDRRDFDVAVFDNRFPSLSARPPEPAVAGSRLMPVEPALGACEVVVYTPQHEGSLGGLSVEQIRRLMAVWAHRTSVLAARPEIGYVYIFENRGEAIGVTLHHPHGQIYGYPVVPPLLEREVAAAQAHRNEHGGCLWCGVAEEERRDGRRVLLDDAGWLATVPFYARWPYEVHLMPRRHVGWLWELSGDEALGLARMLKAVLAKYDALFGFPLPYIMAVHQRPTDGGDHDAYHLHVEFYPPNRTERKLKFLAGSEAGAGAFINDTLPEETAERLRGLAPRSLAELDGADA